MCKLVQTKVISSLKTLKLKLFLPLQTSIKNDDQ